MNGLTGDIPAQLEEAQALFNKRFILALSECDEGLVKAHEKVLSESATDPKLAQALCFLYVALNLSVSMEAQLDPGPSGRPLPN